MIRSPPLPVCGRWRGAGRPSARFRGRNAGRFHHGEHEGHGDPEAGAAEGRLTAASWPRSHRGQTQLRVGGSRGRPTQPNRALCPPSLPLRALRVLRGETSRSQVRSDGEVPPPSVIKCANSSELVISEAAAGDPEAARLRLAALEGFDELVIDDDARELAGALVSGAAIPSEYPEDALHLAVAAVNGMHVVVTWNLRHLNNPFTRMMVRQVLENRGYACPEMRIRATTSRSVNSAAAVYQPGRVRGPVAFTTLRERARGPTGRRVRNRTHVA